MPWPSLSTQKSNSSALISEVSPTRSSFFSVSPIYMLIPTKFLLTRYSLETPFVRSAAEDAWGHSRPTPSALRRCATPPPSPPRPRERSRLQLTPDSVGGTRIDADAPRSAAADALMHTPAHLFENSVHLSHSFRIESQIQ